MISRAELLIILNAADRLKQIDAIEVLLRDGLIVAVCDDDAITAIRTTAAGDAKLRSIKLPTTVA
jgi:hypothetical protein